MIEGGMRSEISAMRGGSSNQMTQSGRSVRVELLDAPDDGVAHVRMSVER